MLRYIPKRKKYTKQLNTKGIRLRYSNWEKNKDYLRFKKEKTILTYLKFLIYDYYADATQNKSQQTT